MTYSTINTIHDSHSLMNRASAAVADQVTSGGVTGDSSFIPSWISQRVWDLAATPGWDDKWESALAGGITDPGANEAVITDGDLLARVQQLLATYPLSEIGLPQL